MYCYVKEKVDLEPGDELGHTEPICDAQDALIRVHVAIVNMVGSGECQILAPSSQSAHLIGTGGAMIKRLRSETHTDIQVSPKNLSDPNPSCVMEFYNFVLVVLDNCIEKNIKLADALQDSESLGKFSHNVERVNELENRAY
ncbi:putative K domain, type 1 protein [Helianthus debilis subsp. tardiflorus]